MFRLLILTIVSFALHPAYNLIAGVITQSNGEISKYTADDGTVIKFYEGSFNQYEAARTSLKGVDLLSNANPWLENASPIADELALAMNNISFTPTSSQVYLFVEGLSNGGPFLDIKEILVETGGTYTRATTSRPKNSAAAGGASFFYAYAEVPEPSTAIAMGLLGVLGFAGNRRRRRQS